LLQNIEQEKFLSSVDVSPLEIVNGEGKANILLTCEHGGRLVPSCLGDLGVVPQEMERHIAYDIGAAALSRLLAAALDAPLFIQPYSRLVVDCNRPFLAPDLAPAISDGTLIPANQDITPQMRQARFDEIHQYFHNHVRQVMQEWREAGRPFLSLGLLFNRDRRLSDALMAEINREFPDIKAAFNEPYSISDGGDYTIPVHGEGSGVPHVLIEIVNDEIEDEAGQQRWCDILGRVLPGAVQAVLD